MPRLGLRSITCLLLLRGFAFGGETAQIEILNVLEGPLSHLVAELDQVGIDPL